LSTLGIDIGSNSVGSAWVDTDRNEIHLGVSVFPAGVDEQENKRGAPKNQARRDKRSQRRTIHRRAERKRCLRKLLVQEGLLPQDLDDFGKLLEANRWPVPSDQDEYQKLLKDNYTVWHVRRDALTRRLHPYEFGRILVHLAQRRGAVGVQIDPDDDDEGKKVKAGMDRLNALMTERGSETVGQLLANLIDERRRSNNGAAWQEPIRNRQYRMPEEDQLFAGRELIRKEFHLLVQRQRSLNDSALAPMLTDDLIRQLDDPSETETWRHGGLLFGQRRTYWDTGTLGRCDLEPTDRCAPEADRHASYYRVIETVNNIRITKRGEPERALTPEERQKVIDALRRQKTGSVATVRKALGIHKKAVKEFYTLNIERDKDRKPNTDWFYREVVHGVFTEERWNQLGERLRESVNRAVLKFDPGNEEHENKLRNTVGLWWALDAAAVDRFIAAWKGRPKLEKRLKLSRRAIRNVLPYMNNYDEKNKRWPTQIEARIRFAEDRSNDATYEQRVRYDLGVQALTKRNRQYLRKHDEPIPPAPMLANPVVRKAVHEVRRHIIAWWHKVGRTPDRIVIEYVRSATQPAKVRNEALARNRKRNAIRKNIIDEFKLGVLSMTQQSRAVERVLLCRQQKALCAYTGQPISEVAAAHGRDVETDHIVPKSRSQDNGFNNKVLVKREANRGKGNKTVKEWMTAGQFAAMEQRLAYLKKGESTDNYFTKKDCGRKWENLHRDAPTTADFLASQLTDTAYAARQVGQWLREVLYDGERDGRRRVFTTKGSYTSILRNDWGLSESELDRQWHNILEPGEGEVDNRSRRARKEKNKSRADHLHHAIDAVCIAFTTPDRIKDLARFAEQQENARAVLGYWPRRKALPPPWPPVHTNPTDDQLRAATAQFREQVLAAAKNLIVYHRPVKRRLVGAFHEDTHYGPVVGPLPAHRTENPQRLFSLRMPVYENRDKRVKPGHLRVPDGWDELSAQLDRAGVPKAAKRAICRRLAALPDPPAGKGGIVRDRTLRDRIRKCLRAAGIDPDNFTLAEIQRIAEDGKLTMKSGVPIKSMILLRTNRNPVIIPRKHLDAKTGKLTPHMDPENPNKPHPRTKRVYIGGNNHHVEIRERTRRRKGETVSEWGGKVVSTFEAAQRNADRLTELKKAGVPMSKKLRQMPRNQRRRFGPIIADVNLRFPVVDRTDNDQVRFVMSLAEGEMIHARRWDSKKKQTIGPADYFVVCKLDKAGNSCSIHFAPHWDARKASEQNRWAVSPADLKNCGPEPGQPPYKVRVSPLGEVRRLEKD
jgi:CRISPR-associated endonuclease Csn1